MQEDFPPSLAPTQEGSSEDVRRLEHANRHTLGKRSVWRIGLLVVVPLMANPFLFLFHSCLISQTAALAIATIASVFA